MSDPWGIPDKAKPGLDDMWSPERVAALLQSEYALLQQYEKEALEVYEPQEIQQQYHACRAPNVILIGGTRAGKTLAGCVEDARCVTNQDPHNKYPKKGTLLLLGYGWNHVGRVFYPMLFMPGAFKIIRDEKTRKWRAFRPWTEEDKAREDEAEDAPPLISPRFYDPKDIAWETKGQNQFVSVKLKTGWTIYAASSESDARHAQGFRVMRVHVDEDLADERWIGELTSRKAQDRGILHWTAVPHSRNEAMLRMVEGAEKEADKEKPVYQVFRLPFLANKHIDEEAKRIALVEWANEGDDVLRMRSEGEFTYDSVLMYPTFDLGLHGYNRSELPNREVPKDWTRFVAIDPGSQVMAAVFGAIPPTDDMVLIYDELYIQQCDAVKFAEAMQTKCKGYSFNAFIMDFHGARLRDIGGGLSPLEQYRNQLEIRGIRSEKSGHGFIPGSTNKDSRAEAVRHALRIIDGDDAPRLRFLVDDANDTRSPATPHTVRTIKRYRKKQDAKGRVSDEPETRGDVHAAQCLEYLMAHRGLHYIEPKKVSAGPSEAELIRKQHDKWLNPHRNEARQTVHFGPATLFR